MTMTLYSWPRSSGGRVNWALEELGVPFQVVRPDRAAGEHRAPAYLAVNPNGKVPALVDGDERVFESLACFIHLGEKYGVAKGLWPADGPRRAEALSWLVWSTTELQGFGMEFLYHGCDTPVSYAPADRSKACADYNGGELRRMLGMLEQRLADREYLMGDFSLLDCAPAAWLSFVGAIGSGIKPGPVGARWLARCQARPAFARGMGA